MPAYRLIRGVLLRPPSLASALITLCMLAAFLRACPGALQAPAGAWVPTGELEAAAPRLSGEEGFVSQAVCRQA